MTRSTSAARTVTLALALVSSAVLAQAPAVSVADDQCVVRVQYPILAGSVIPADQPVVRLYFRAAQHPGFYWVRMAAGATGYQAILPVPAPETTHVVFYVEAVAADFTTVRTPEQTVAVVGAADECDRSPLLFNGSDPEIVLTSTAAGAPAVPPGFAPAGIAGTVAGPAAVASATSPGWLLPVAIVGGFGSVLLLDALDDDDEEPVSPVLP